MDQTFLIVNVLTNIEVLLCGYGSETSAKNPTGAIRAAKTERRRQNYRQKMDRSCSAIIATRGHWSLSQQLWALGGAKDKLRIKKKCTQPRQKQDIAWIEPNKEVKLFSIWIITVCSRRLCAQRKKDLDSAVVNPSEEMISQALGLFF